MQPEFRHSKPNLFFYYYSHNEFDIIPKTQFAINFWGQTTRYEGNYKRNSMFVLGASFSRTFFEKLQVSLNFNDIFQQMNYGETYQINNIYTNSLFFADGNFTFRALYPCSTFTHSSQTNTGSS